MKKSRKLLCVLLALVMVVSLLPVMAFAADEDVAAEETTAATVEETSPETEGVVSDVIKNLFAKLPNYLVAVKTSDGRVAAGAQVVIYNQNKDQVATAVANYGVAIFCKKDHLNTYSCPPPGPTRTPTLSISPSSASTGPSARSPTSTSSRFTRRST